jgi:phage terminase large subunit GpA-like protein
MIDVTAQVAAGDLPALPALSASVFADVADPASRLAYAAARGFEPDADLTVSQWADRHRILSGKSGAEPGHYRTARTAFLRQIMDTLSPSHPAQKVVFMKGAQVGGTECGNNWLAFCIAQAPGPIIAVQPTVELAERFSKQRIDPMIESTPALRQLVKPARARDSGNTILSKSFEGGILILTGANSAVGLRSMPARYAFLDEIDAYDPDADGEGDPVELAVARTKTYGFRKKIFLVSTPKFKGTSRIEREYLASDQRRYFVPCPHCGHMQYLRFENLRWTKGQPETAAYHCESCGSAATEADKTDMLARGEWRATATPKDPLTAGFHLSSLYSPVGWASWVDVAKGFEQAQEAGTEAMRVWTNTVLGETWEERGDAPDWERLLERRENFPMGVVPRGAVVLAAGIDNQAQPERLEMAVWAFGPGYESWLVDVRQFLGSPASAETWDQVKAVLDADWPREAGGTMRIAKVGADTGGQHTAGVYEQLRRLRDLRHPRISRAT